MGTVLLGVVEGDALLQVRADSVPFSQKGQGIAQRDMGTREVCWILDTLSQTEQLFPQLPRRLILPPMDIKTHQAAQHWGELWGLPHLQAQLARPVIDGCHLRSRKALGRHQRVQCPLPLLLGS